MPSCVIIGAGISGLSCAVLLAEHGWEVTVLEAHAVPGGLLQRFRRGPYRFDTGFHFLTGAAPGGPLRRLARRLGVLDAMRFLPLDQDAQFRVHLPGGGEVDIPVGIERARDAFAARWPEQRAAIDAFFRLLGGGMRARTWLSALAPADSDPPGGERESVATALARCGVSGEAREVIGALAAILAMRAEDCPLELYAAFAGTALAGSYRAAGGGEALIAPLVARLAALGGRLLLKRAATRIHFDDRVATAVEDARGQVHRADLFIASCHPDEILRLTGPGGMRPSLAERVLSTPDSASAVLVYAALDQAALDRAARNGKPPSLGARHHFARLGADGDLYYLAPSAFEAAALDGDALATAPPPYLEAMLWVPTDVVAAWRDTERGRRCAAYDAWKAAISAEMLAAIVAAHPELDGAISRTWSSSPLTIRHYVRSRNGAAMGLSHDLDALGSEPMPRRNRLRNLCFTGQSIGHPGVLGCIIEAFVLCAHLIGKDLEADVAADAPPTR